MSEKNFHLLRVRRESATATTVELDGVPLRRCRALTLKGKAGDFWVATIEVYVEPDVEIPADVEMRFVDVTALDSVAREYRVVPE